MRHSDGLTRAPVGTKYVVEAHGSFIRRYVEFPNGRTVALARRKAVSRTVDGNPRVRKAASTLQQRPTRSAY